MTVVHVCEHVLRSDSGTCTCFLLWQPYPRKEYLKRAVLLWSLAVSSNLEAFLINSPCPVSVQKTILTCRFSQYELPNSVNFYHTTRSHIMTSSNVQRKLRFSHKATISALNTETVNGNCTFRNFYVCSFARRHEPLFQKYSSTTLSRGGYGYFSTLKEGKNYKPSRMMNVQGMFKSRTGYFTLLVYCYGLAIFTLQTRRHGSWDVGVQRLRDADRRCPLLGLATAPNSVEAVALVRVYVHCRILCLKLTGIDTQKDMLTQTYTYLTVWNAIVKVWAGSLCFIP